MAYCVILEFFFISEAYSGTYEISHIFIRNSILDV